MTLVRCATDGYPPGRSNPSSRFLLLWMLCSSFYLPETPFSCRSHDINTIPWTTSPWLIVWDSLPVSSGLTGTTMPAYAEDAVLAHRPSWLYLATEVAGLKRYPSQSLEIAHLSLGVDLPSGRRLAVSSGRLRYQELYVF